MSLRIDTNIAEINAIKIYRSSQGRRLQAHGLVRDMDVALFVGHHGRVYACGNYETSRRTRRDFIRTVYAPQVVECLFLLGMVSKTARDEFMKEDESRSNALRRQCDANAVTAAADRHGFTLNKRQKKALGIKG